MLMNYKDFSDKSLHHWGITDRSSRQFADSSAAGKAAENKNGDATNESDETSPDHYGPDNNTKDKESEVRTEVKRNKYKTKSTQGSPGVSTTETSYELDHRNSLLEIEAKVKSLNGVTDNVDLVAEWLGGVGTVKGVIDQGGKAFKYPSIFKKSGIVFVGTHLGLTNMKVEQQTAMYQNVLSTYLDLHSTNPINMSGIRVNMTSYEAPYGNTYTKYSFYDLYSGGYLGGDTFK